MCEENLILLTDAYWTFAGKANAAVYILQHMCRFVTRNLWDIFTWGTAGLLSGTRNSQEWKWQGDVCYGWMLLSITLPGWIIWKQFWVYIPRNECSACCANPAGMGFCEWNTQPLSLTPSRWYCQNIHLPFLCHTPQNHFMCFIELSFPSQCAEDPRFQLFWPLWCNFRVMMLKNRLFLTSKCTHRATGSGGRE